MGEKNMADYCEEVINKSETTTQWSGKYDISIMDYLMNLPTSICLLPPHVDIIIEAQNCSTKKALNSFIFTRRKNDAYKIHFNWLGRNKNCHKTFPQITFLLTTRNQHSLTMSFSPRKKRRRHTRRGNLSWGGEDENTLKFVKKFVA